MSEANARSEFDMGLSVALVHYPTVNKQGTVVATSVTNFDVHDIARAARTFDLDHYFIVTPLAMQRDFVRRIMQHWLEGEGAEYNPSRRESLENVEVLPDLVAVGNAIAREHGREPYWVATSARAGKLTATSEDIQNRLKAGENVCLIFGTGYGLHSEVMELADAVLEPIRGPGDFNHLSVRSAVSIYLDRLVGRV